MLELEEQLRRYGDAVGESLVASGDPDGRDGRESRVDRSAQGWSHRRTLRIAASLVVVGSVAAGVLGYERANRSDTPDVAASGISADALFDTPTDTVLVFSDGIDGITAVDLDAGLAARRVIEGERAGDQPFRISLVADHLVVGWGEIYAAPLDGGPSIPLDDARIYIPAAEQGEVWTINPAPVEHGHVPIKRVAMDGTVVVSSSSLDLDEYFPVYGVPGGLVAQGPRGLAIWNAASGRLGDLVGATVPPASMSSDGSHLAWCDEACIDPQVVELEQQGPPTPPSAVPGQRLALSPDGRHLAALQSEGGESALIVINLATGQETAVPASIPGAGSIQWAADGNQLFYAYGSAAAGDTRLGRYDLSTGAWDAVELDIATGPLSFVPIDRDQASALMVGERVEAAACEEAGTSYPSGRTDPCSFPINSTPVDTGAGSDDTTAP